MDKYLCIAFSVLVICISAIWITSDLTKSTPNLTDPIAQRIWAATRNNYSSDENAKLIREATTYTDSVVIINK